MQTLIGKTETEWVDHAWTWLNTHARPGQKVFVPAGGTPKPLYQRWRAEPSELLKSLRFLQLDEIISGPKRGVFRGFLETELAPYRSQISWIETADEVADLAILGVGLNGHVAFHEPDVPRAFASGCVRLSAETCRALDLQETTWGLTYGVGTFLRARAILVLAQGPAKRKVLCEALEARRLPVAWILEHPNVTLVTDLPL